MTSHPRKDNDHTKFMNKSPHFFKVILKEAIQGGKLGIPRSFVRKHGKQLSSPVKLEVPSGAIWQVELTKCDDRVWLQKGWKEFAEYYSLELGDFVVFRYDGNAHFHVFIFDKSASEIVYPYHSSEDDDPMPAELSDDISASRKSKKKSHLPCPRPHKKMRSVKTEVFGCLQQLTPTEKAHAIQRAIAFKSTGNPHFMVVMQPSFVSNNYRMCIPSKFARKFLPMQNAKLTLRDSSGKTWPARYYCNAKGKFINAKITGGWRAFAQDNNLDVGDVCVFELIKHREIVMNVVIVNHIAEDASKTRQPLADGTITSRDNKIRSLVGNIEDGDDISVDLCDVSVSRKSKEKSHWQCPRPPRKSIRTDLPCETRTFLKSENLSTNINPDDARSRRIKLGNVNKIDKSPCSTGHLDATEGVEGIKARRSMKTEVLSCVQKLTATKKAQAIQIAGSFKSTENPCFMVVMQPSFVRDRCRLGIPSNFARKFLTKQNGNLTLCDSSGKTWPAKYCRAAENKKPNAQICAGWKAFVEDNNLDVGDFCIFELIKHPEILMEVIIYPVVQTASKACSRPLADGSIASRVKMNRLVNHTALNYRQRGYPFSSRELKDPKIEESGNTHSYIEILDDVPNKPENKEEIANPMLD